MEPHPTGQPVAQQPIAQPPPPPMQFYPTAADYQQLVDQVRLLTIQLEGTRQQTQASSKVKVNPPKEFHGARDETSSFLAQCELVFRANPALYNDDQVRVIYMVSYLRGDAFKWYESAILRPNLNNIAYEQFKTLFKATFGEDTNVQIDKAYADLRRCQQTKSCQAYSTRFLQLASRVDANKSTKMNFYREGLKAEVKLHLIGLRPAPATLAELIQAAVQYDDAYHRIKSAGYRPATTSGPRFTPSTPVTSTGPTPMNIDSQKVTTTGKLTDAERKRRKDNHLCMYDGDKDCPGAKDINLCPKLKKKNPQKATQPSEAVKT